MDEFSEFGQSGPSACGVAAYQRVAEFYEVFEGQLFGRLGEQRLGEVRGAHAPRWLHAEASVLDRAAGNDVFRARPPRGSERDSRCGAVLR